MTTFEMCKQIRRMLVTDAAEVIIYNWEPKFAVDSLKLAVTKIRGITEFVPIDPTDLSYEEMEELGFGKWQEDNPIRLIPLWLYPFLADVVELGGSIQGLETRHIKREDMDTDHRFGYLAYGVIPKKG